MGQSLEDIDVLLNILIICHLSLEDSGGKLEKILEGDQEKELARFTGHIKFNEGLTTRSESKSIENYIGNHDERVLLAFVFNEMIVAGFTKRNDELSKYLLMVGINIVNCISIAQISS